ncbi:MAG: carboxypeptidase-like regulatory domain-containing protein, partial [Ulvibacter sp.]|nr:carboxypeptidase-like regulatory domain-containing protein [Ulvibacter sp.]
MLFSATIFGQQSKISGTVLDQNNAPISFVTVLVNNVSEEKGASGAVFVKGTTTDDLGNFTLENVEHGNYTLHFSFIGFQSQTKQIHLTSPVFLEAIVLLESSEMLDQAVITIKRPTIQKSPGRLVFNVENTSVASGSALDVLKKTPGVVVSQQGVSVKNNSPVIYVNNKRVYLSGEETLSLLESTNGSLIKSVEVITNPSSK